MTKAMRIEREGIREGRSSVQMRYGPPRAMAKKRRMGHDLGRLRMRIEQGKRSMRERKRKKMRKRD
jgi:hypothetical protein